MEAELVSTFIVSTAIVFFIISHLLYNRNRTFSYVLGVLAVLMVPVSFIISVEIRPFFADTTLYHLGLSVAYFSSGVALFFQVKEERQTYKILSSIFYISALTIITVGWVY